MSTITTKYPTIDDIYDNATKQKEANKETERIAKENNATTAKEETQALNKQVDDAKKDAQAYYDEIYDANAVNQYISEERVAENMANLGLTNSGLNATQLTAIETSRGNADNRTRLQEQAAIDDIELKLSEGLAEIDRKQRLADAEAESTRIQADAAVDTQATNDAIDWVNENNQNIIDADKAANEARTKDISAATTAVKNLKANYVDDNTILSTIEHYSEQYDMSETEFITMCANAGIDTNTAKNRYLQMNATQIILSDYTKSENYEAAFKEYNITENGRKYLVPDLIKKGVLSENDGYRIDEFWTLYLKGLVSLKKTQSKSDSSVGLEGAVNTALHYILGLEKDGLTSSAATSYMIGLLNYHGLSEYIPEKITLI